MTDAYLMAQTLGFATGSALSALLLVLVWKAERLTGKTHCGSWAVTLMLLWNAASLVRYATLLMGFELVSRLANACAYSAIAVFPAVGLMMLPWRRQRSWQYYSGLGLRYLSFATGTVLSLGLFAASLSQGFAFRFQTLTQSAAYNVVFHLVIAWLLLRGGGQATPPVRSLTKTLLLIMSGVGVASILTFHVTLSPTAIEVIETCTQQATIPMSIAMFAFLTQFRFADVFVKRSLTIIAAVMVTTIYTSLVNAPLAQAVRAVAPRAEAAAWSVTAILWCTLLLLFPRCERAINRVADRWLFRRPDYRRLTIDFSCEAESAANESELFAQAAHRIQAALDAACVRVIPRAEWLLLGDELEPLSGEVTKLEAGHPARRCLGKPEPEVLVPIRVNSLITHLVAIAPGERGRKLLSDELAFLSALAERMGRKLEALLFESERHEQHLREARWQHLLTVAELKALRAQVNPHFLFNTLNTIVDLISSEPKKAEVMTTRLAEVFRYVLARAECNLITVGEEFSFIRTYLEIEQVRFGERLRVDMAVDPQIATTLIPPLLLQPLVENAIKHGLAPKLAGGELHIRAIDEGEYLGLIIEDNGAGWRTQHYQSRCPVQGVQGGLGLRNVTERLQTLYGARASIAIRSAAAEGTRISILIPKNDTQNLDHR